jgi:transketolase
LFDAQDNAYRQRVLGTGTVRVGIEAAVRQGWDRYLGDHGGFIGMNGFGASGPADALYSLFGITPQAVVAEATRLLKSQA